MTDMVESPIAEPVEPVAPPATRKRRTPAEMAHATPSASNLIHYGKVFHEQDGAKRQMIPDTYEKQALISAMERIATNRRMVIEWRTEDDQIIVKNPRSGQKEQCNIRMPLDKIVGWAERAATTVYHPGQQNELREATAIEFTGGNMDGALVQAARSRKVMAPGIDNQEYGFRVV